MADYGANIQQEGDVYHYDGTDGGMVEMVGGELRMTTGIESLIYDCWFGGNFDDDGSAATEKRQWCGNEYMPADLRSRGRLQSTMDGRPLNSSTLGDIEKAARDDILSQTPRTIISDVSVSGAIPQPNRVDLYATVTMATGAVHTVTVKGIPV